MNTATGQWIKRLDENLVERVPELGKAVLCVARDGKGKQRPLVARLMVVGSERMWQWWDKPKQGTGLVALEQVEKWAEINL